jgi:hypothetical protein
MARLKQIPPLNPPITINSKREFIDIFGQPEPTPSPKDKMLEQQLTRQVKIESLDSENQDEFQIEKIRNKLKARYNIYRDVDDVIEIAAKMISYQRSLNKKENK